MTGGGGGEPELRQSIELALSIEDADTACRGYVNLSWVLVTLHEMPAAEAAAGEGLALALEAEHQTYETHLTAILSRIAMADCDWRRALDLGAAVPARSHTSRGVTLVVEAMVATRTASGRPFEKLREAWQVAERAEMTVSSSRHPTRLMSVHVGASGGRGRPLLRCPGGGQVGRGAGAGCRRRSGGPVDGGGSAPLRY